MAYRNYCDIKEGKGVIGAWLFREFWSFKEPTFEVFIVLEPSFLDLNYMLIWIHEASVFNLFYYTYLGLEKIIYDLVLMI